MKNIIKTLGLVGIVALSSGCKEDKITSEYTISEEKFNEVIGELAYYSPRPEFKVHGVSTYRNYPCSGPQKQLPRAEFRMYESGKKTVDLYFPKKE